MGVKRILTLSALFFQFLLLAVPVFAQDALTPPPLVAADSNNVEDAADANGCQSKIIEATGMYATPSNCLFLEEPLDDKNLYIVECVENKAKKKIECLTNKYNGGVIPVGAHGPLQAILTRQASKPEQGSFGLLYNYLHLIYNYMSGIIIGVSVLFVVVGGIQIATAGGESGGVESGKKRIIQAISGLILWFTASLILYTINPTFFSL